MTNNLKIYNTTGKLYDVDDKMYVYSGNEIKNMSLSNTWFNSIERTNDFKTNNTNYKLHATGDMNLFSGRKYVALPSNIDPKDPYIKEKYNLM